MYSMCSMHSINCLFQLAKQCGIAFVLTLLLFSGLSVVHAADEPDLESPLVSIDAVEEGLQAESQVFTVFVTDNNQLDDVSILYRFKNPTLTSDNTYVSKKMSQLASSDIYTHTIPASEIGPDTDRIEYYIRAVDEAGNLSLEGFSFDPLVRTLVGDTQLSDANKQTDVTSPSTAPEIGMSTSRKLLYGALGVVVVGALISASDSGSGGGSSAVSDQAGVGVTILVDPPAGAE